MFIFFLTKINLQLTENTKAFLKKLTARAADAGNRAV
jgi:hypothetical protein